MTGSTAASHGDCRHRPGGAARPEPRPEPRPRRRCHKLPVSQVKSESGTTHDKLENLNIRKGLERRGARPGPARPGGGGRNRDKLTESDSVIKFTTFNLKFRVRPAGNLKLPSRESPPPFPGPKPGRAQGTGGAADTESLRDSGPPASATRPGRIAKVHTRICSLSYDDTYLWLRQLTLDNLKPACNIHLKPQPTILAAESCDSAAPRQF